MPAIRFNSVFAVLMALSLVSAFILPASYTTPGRSPLPGLFSPISRPVRWIAAGIDHRAHHATVVVDPISPAQPRAPQSVYDENAELRADLASLQMKFDQLSQLNADRAAMGDIRTLCRPAAVTAGDAQGAREVLTITAPVAASLLLDRPVIRGNPSDALARCELVGRVVQAGPVGAHVRLITDPGFALSARIARYEPQPNGSLKLIYLDKMHPLIRGIGHNLMTVANNPTMKEVHDAGIEVNDVVLLDDPEWPTNIQGFELGRITRIMRQTKKPLLADIEVEPAGVLMRLSEVMVMVRN